MFVTASAEPTNAGGSAPITGKWGRRANYTAPRNGVSANLACDFHHPFPDVSVWYARHTFPLNTDDFDTRLTEQDRLEFADIRHGPTRDRSLRTRARLREALSHVTGCVIGAEKWVFTRGEHGKPAVHQALPQLHFSCSHTPWMSVIAVARFHPVGIDIECAEPISEPSLVDDYFTASERLAVSELPYSARPQARARLWALKEATIKMLGMGFAYDIAQLDFDTTEDCLNTGPDEGPNLSAMRIATWSIPSKTQPLSVALTVRN